jgi:sugar fermentation stimulation protein A
MIFPTLVHGILLRRYKRFLADIRLDTGEVITAHIPNTGPMTGCCTPDSQVFLTHKPSPTRKLHHTWEIIKVDGHWIGVNTHQANFIAREAIEQGKIPELFGYKNLQMEVKYGKDSRIDILLSKGTELCYVEVKNVTLKEGEKAYFPDAVSTRGTKHLTELTQVIKEGQKASTIYLVNRSDCKEFRPASHIDPAYAKALNVAEKAGMLVLPYTCTVSPQGIEVIKRLPYIL